MTITHRLRSTIAVGVLFVIAGWQLGSACAQQSTRSHRVLPFPQDSDSHDSTHGLSHQFRMLQHLQQLVGQRDQSGNNEQNKINAELLEQLRHRISPQDREILDGMRSQFEQLSGLNSGELDELNKGLADIMDDPQNAAFHAERMLKQFSRDREPPMDQNGTNGNAPIAPSQQNQPRSALNVRTQDGETQNSGAQDNGAQNGRGRALRTRTGTTIVDSPERERGTSNTAPRLLDRRTTPRAIPRQESSRGMTGSPDAATSSGVRQRQTTRSNPERLPGRTRRLEPAGAGQRLNELVRRGLSEDDIRKLLQSTRALSAPEESKTVDDSDPPSVSELIRKSKEDPASLPPLNIPPNSLEDLKRLLGERFSRNKLNKRPAWVNRIRNYLPSDVRDELRQSGLEQVVTDIVDNVREDPQEESSGVSNAHNRSKQPPSVASPNSNNGRYGKSLQDRLSELTKALRSGPPSREKPTSTNSPQKPTANDSPRSTKDKDNPSIAKRFTDFYQSFTRRDDNESSASGKALVSGSYLSFEIVVAGLAISVLGGCLLYFGTRGDARHPAQPTLARSDAKRISSREDLIRAFHFLTHSCDSSAENWWSHRRAARLLADTRPTALSDVETLTNLYEVARYSPDHDTMSETEFRIARRAVESLIQ